MGNLSAHFDSKEFRCKCGCGFGDKPGDIDQRLISDLEALRVAIEKPVHVVSGCRCKAYNAKCGGVMSSQHLLGVAADITVAGMTPDELKAAVLMTCPNVSKGGIGVYRKQGFVHADVRRNVARWDDEPKVTA